MTRYIALLVVLALAGCAHTTASVVACAAQLTPEQISAAAGALTGQDYEGAVDRELAGLAACLVVAAVEAAVDQARRYKLAGTSDQAAIARHGDAWLKAHRFQQPP